MTYHSFRSHSYFFFNDPQFDVPVFQARIFYITNNVSTQIFPLFRRHKSWIVTRYEAEQKKATLILKIVEKSALKAKLIAML